MAAKKENVNEAVVKEEGEKLVKIVIPRTRKDEPDVYVGVNDRSWLIKRGVEVEVPECVAEVIRHSEEMKNIAFDFEESAGH